MNFTKKMAASLLAAAMTCSLFGAAVGAVEFSVVGDTGNNTAAGNNSQTVTTSSTVQNAVPEFFDGCVKLSWTAVPGATYYAVKICDTDSNVIETYYVKNVTAMVVPETAFNVEYNSKKDFYACVIALKPGETDVTGTAFYAPSASKFTVEYDMDKYPEYGAPQDVTFMVNSGKVFISWKNPNDFAEKKDLFTVSVLDSQKKSVFSKTIQDTHIEVSGLKDGQTYTVNIYNKTFSTMTGSEYKFVSDVKEQTAGTNKDTTVRPQKGTNYTLPAPLTVKAKAGDGRITLSWSSVDEADGYRIFAYNAKTKQYETFKTVKGTKYTIKDLKNGSTYKYRVAAVRYDKNTKIYTPGTASKTVKATPQKAKNSKNS